MNEAVANDPMIEENVLAAVPIEGSSPTGMLDDLPLSSFQIWSVLMIAATVILDGLDNQMLGLAAPSLLKEWGIDRAALGSVFALGFVGMAVGTLTSGWVGDRFGRRGALIIGVAIFGVATLLTGFSNALWQVAALKTLAGVGLGGVPGTASAMIAEFTPVRWRSVAVTFGVVCVSIGGILGGVAAALILPGLGWRWLFYIGGTVTMIFVAWLWFVLPESPATSPNGPIAPPNWTASCAASAIPIPRRSPMSPSPPGKPPATNRCVTCSARRCCATRWRWPSPCFPACS